MPWIESVHITINDLEFIFYNANILSHVLEQICVCHMRESAGWWCQQGNVYSQRTYCEILCRARQTAWTENCFHCCNQHRLYKDNNMNFEHPSFAVLNVYEK